ncbi:MAG: 4Fe-4S binding protein [Deltaproteobacteria bacterium]|nr:4Fe-4S binding protein [Deltaproteobacteria bacterium]
MSWWREALQAGFRLFPWPTEPGLRQVGHPGESSPVLLTGNYDLSVRRVMHALEGQDAWVVVAPSGGINVWCAAAGGHLSTHQIVTALKTCGVADRVQHRRVILPQLAATGALALEVFRRCHWKVTFGPVRAQDLPAYLATGEKTDAMRRVQFGLRDRLEMAAAWAVPTALLLGMLALVLRPGWALPVVAAVAAMAVAVFTVYERLGPARRVVLAGAGVVVALSATMLAGGGTAAIVLAVALPLLLTAVLTFDYEGSTPTEGGSHFEERRWRIALDPERCEGVYRCWEVCPEACFEKRESERKVELAHDERCIRCGACVVQCPKDALFFQDAEGTRIEPDVIRRFKLNLLGQRSVDAS